MDLDLIKKLSDSGESEYAATPSSGRGNGEVIIDKDKIISNAKSISVRKPFVMVVGSVATQAESKNDLDLVIRGEDFPEKIKEAVEFRLYRLFTDIIGCKYDDIMKYCHIHWSNSGSYSVHPHTVIPIIKDGLLDFFKIEEVFGFLDSEIYKDEDIEVKNGKDLSTLSVDGEGKTIITPIKKIIRHPYRGNIIRINGPEGCIRISENHSLYTPKLDTAKPTSNEILFRFDFVDEYPTGKELNNIMVPDLSIRYQRNNNLNNISIDNANLIPFLTIIADYITEGSLGTHRICISNHSKEFLEESIKSYKIFGNNPKKCGSKTQPEGIRIGHKRFLEYLAFNCGKYAENKKMPSFIWGLKKEYQRYFFERLLKGDGWNSNYYLGYATKSIILSIQMRYLGNLLGYYTSSKRRIGKNSEWYEVLFHGKSEAKHYKCNSWESEFFDGYLYDLESNGKFYANHLLASNTSYIPLYELNLVPMTNTETIEMARIPLELKGDIKIIQKGKNERIIGGYASVAVIDTENQFIPLETLKDGLQTLIGDPSYANLMLVHKNIQIGKIIPEYGEYKTKVDDKGLFILANIRSNIETANEVWKMILDGKLNGFSIGCEVLASHEHCDDKECITVLDKINIFEVSVCGSPINKESGFIIISKSKYNKDVCNDCNKIGNIENSMTENISVEEKAKPKEEKPEELVEPKEEEKTEVDTISERLDTIEKTISAIEGLIRNAKKPVEEEKPIEEPVNEEEEKKAEKKPEEKPTKYPYPEDEKKKTGETEPCCECSLEEFSAYSDFIKSCMGEGKSMKDCAAEWKEKQKAGKKEYPYPKPSEYPYPKKADFDEFKSEIKKSVDELVSVIKAKTEESKKEEYEMALKSRDDQIEALNKKIELITKSKDEKAEPKTVQEVKTEPMVELDDFDERISRTEKSEFRIRI